MGMLPNLKLLGKMLAVVVALMLLIAFASIASSPGGTGTNYVWLAIFIPIGLFAFIIAKFRRSGIVAVTGFAGFLFILSGLYAHGTAGLVIWIAIGAILMFVSILLARRWKVKPSDLPADKGKSANS